MAVALILVDTPILIDHLRGRPEAVSYLGAQVAAKQVLYCSVITHAEVLAGMRPQDEVATRALLSALQPVPVDLVIAETAGRYRRIYGPSHGVLLPDALIAASANALGAVVATLNVRHFPMSDITVTCPY